MESCDALTKKGYTCSHGAKYCIAYNGEVKNICSLHKNYLDSGTESKSKDSKKSSDFFYDKKHNKLVVNRIARVPHDELTGLPTRYTEGLTDKQKLKYLKEIEETKEYYKRTGKVKGREPVSRSLSPHRSNYVQEFEKRFNFKISDVDHVHATFPDMNYEKILQKGRAAFASGSRPTVTGSGGPTQWSLARAASVAVGGPALATDKNLVGPKSLKVIYSHIPK